MNIETLKEKKASLLNEVNDLVAKKNELYSIVDIESPMSTEEKELNSQISNIYSEINAIVRSIRKAA